MSELTAQDVVFAPPAPNTIVIRPCGPHPSIGDAEFWLIYDRGMPRWIRDTAHDAQQCAFNMLIARRRP